MKKILTIVVSVIMAISMTACGGNTDTTTQSSSEKSADIEGSSVETADKGITDMELYVDFTWFSYDWVGVIPETLSKNGGVNFNVTHSVKDEQLGTWIASGDLPEIIWTSNEIDRLCSSDLCYSYDELIEKYNIDWEPSSDRVAIARSHNADKDDQHYYTIIQNYNTNDEWHETDGVVPQIASFDYRKDIWEEIGSPSMNTIDEIHDVLLTVHEKYPEMDIINAASPTWRFGALYAWFGCSNEFLYEEDGKTVRYRDTIPEFYDLTKFINQLYREGLFTEENVSITQEDGQAAAKAYAGENFLFDTNLRPTHLESHNKELKTQCGDSAEFSCLSIPDDSKEIVRANAGWSGVFITKNCKDPEAAIKMIAYLNSEEGRRLALWGREGIDYTLNEKGIPQFSETWQEARQDSDQFHLDYNNEFYMCTTELDEGITYYSGQPSDVLAAYTKNSDKIVNYPELGIALPTSTSDMGVIRAEINNARSNNIAKLYLAATDEEFEAAYENYMEILKQCGVEELNKYMTESVEQVKVDFGF